MVGLTGYCHKFIPAYGDFVQPFQQLTYKTIPFIWMDQCRKGFEMLKDALKKSPILVYPDWNKLYTLFTGAF